MQYFTIRGKVYRNVYLRLAESLKSFKSLSKEPFIQLMLFYFQHYLFYYESCFYVHLLFLNLITGVFYSLYFTDNIILIIIRQISSYFLIYKFK